jgi:phosphatidate phosphatase APP1
MLEKFSKNNFINSFKSSIDKSNQLVENMSNNSTNNEFSLPNIEKDYLEINNDINPNPPKKEHVNIVFFQTYGNEQEVKIKGRVIESDDKSSETSLDSDIKNFFRNLDILNNNEIENINVDINFNGKVIKTKTDDDGIFEITVKNFGKITTGFNNVVGQVSKEQNKYVSDKAIGKITIQEKNDITFGVISDIDDTIQKSYAPNKLKAVKTLLFNNYKTQEKIMGTSELYNILDKKSDGKVDGDLYYISGSPMQLNQRIESFLDYNNFPDGSIELKKMGLGKNDDSPTKQIDYKLNKLRALFDEYPNKKFILFGDSGEKDPEIYKQISKEYPSRVIAIYINNVTNDDKNSARYEGLNLTKDASESSFDLYKRGLISFEDYQSVKESIK